MVYKIQPVEITKYKILGVSTLLQSHVHSCEHSFVIKLKRVKILDFVISIYISAFLLYFLKLPAGNGFESVYCNLDASMQFI